MLLVLVLLQLLVLVLVLQLLLLQKQVHVQLLADQVPAVQTTGQEVAGACCTCPLLLLLLLGQRLLQGQERQALHLRRAWQPFHQLHALCGRRRGRGARRLVCVVLLSQQLHQGLELRLRRVASRLPADLQLLQQPVQLCDA
jgi:hypothetical protein